MKIEAEPSRRTTGTKRNAREENMGGDRKGKGSMYVVYRYENGQTLYTEYTQKVRNPIACSYFDILFSNLVVSAHLLVRVSNF